MLKELGIDRQKWARGGNLGQARMLNKEGNMCCLGFLGKACGFTESQLANRYTPDDTLMYARVFGTEAKFPEGVVDADGRNSSWVAVAARINDNKQIDDEDREGILAEHFKSIGIALTFIN